MLEIPTPCSTARGKKLALDSPLIGEEVQFIEAKFIEAECSMGTGKYSFSLFCHSDILLGPELLKASITHTHSNFFRSTC